MEDYEKLLRGKVFKVLRSRRQKEGGCTDGEVIVTEQEIDEEILRNPRDRREEYKKLKFAQVYRRLYDLEYRKVEKERRSGVAVRARGRDRVNISDEMVIAEIVREQRELLTS
jgi:hypothetical protein